MKQKKIKAGNIVKITWLDAFGRGSWNRMVDIEEGLKHHIIAEIVGYYAREDKNFSAFNGDTDRPNVSSVPALGVYTKRVGYGNKGIGKITPNLLLKNETTKTRL